MTFNPGVFEAKLMERREVAEETFLITLGISPNFKFAAGQYVLLSAQFQNGERLSRELSIASTPRRVGRIELAYRNSISRFKEVMRGMPVSSILSVEGPFGNFTFPENPERILCIAQGIGITPFRSIIFDAKERNIKHQINLVYINRKESRAVFWGEFKAYQDCSLSFHCRSVIGALTSEDIGGIASEFGDAKIFVAGAADKVFEIRTRLIENGIGEAKIKTEEFTGYGKG